MDERIEALAQEARAFLEHRWADWFAAKGKQPKVVSAGMCRFSVYFLREIFSEEFGGGWFVDGGSPFEHDGSPAEFGGMSDTHGCWHGHYWLSGPGGVIVDVTADQFGHQPVCISEDGDPRYQVNFTDDEIHEHLKDVAWRVRDWLAQWRDERAAVMAPGR